MQLKKQLNIYVKQYKNWTVPGSVKKHLSMFLSLKKGGSKVKERKESKKGSSVADV